MDNWTVSEAVDVLCVDGQYRVNFDVFEGLGDTLPEALIDLAEQMLEGRE